MKNNIIHTTLFLLLTLLFSCEKIVTNVDVPEAEKELVLFSFLSPEGDYTSASVSFSQPIFGHQNNSNQGKRTITNAVVTITELSSNQTANLTYVDSLDEYAISQQSFTIKSGQTYQVAASYQGKNIYGQTTILNDTASITTAEWISYGNSNGNSPSGKLVYKWDDFANKPNYYRVITQNYFNGIDGFSSYNICDNIYNDDGKDGTTLNSTCEVYTNINDTPSANIYVLHTDKGYYEYMKRRLNYIYDSPFTEPTPQYNNVSGGLGVVCSYRLSKRTVKLN